MRWCCGCPVPGVWGQGFSALLRQPCPKDSSAATASATCISLLASLGRAQQRQTAVAAKDILGTTLGELRERYGFALIGYVAMPEHMHLLIGEPSRGTSSTVMQVLKQRVSRRLRLKRRCSTRQLMLRFAREPLPRFWQLRFHDFSVWSHKKRVEKLHYMHMNPVKRGLVSHPKDWPWSSFAFCSGGGGGLVPIDPVQ